jgi:hypothetical protein
MSRTNCEFTAQSVYIKVLENLGYVFVPKLKVDISFLHALLYVLKKLAG